MIPPRRRGVNVLLVTPGFPADETDDNCIPPLQITLRALSTRHPELRLTVLAVNYPPHREAYEWHGLRVVPLGGCNRPWPFRLPAMRRGLAAARRIHNEEPVNLVHGLWLGDAALLGFLTARRLGVPMAATALGQDVRPSNRYLRLLPLGSMKLGAVSKRAAADLQTSTGGPVGTVLPWGLDKVSGKLPSWRDRKLDLLGVGSLTANKDFATFIGVVERLCSEGRPIRAAIIGDGPERASIGDEIRRRNLSGAIELRGHQPRATVLETMRDAKVLLHPARFESFGFVFLEALAHGMAVVSRSVGIAEPGPRWYLWDDDGEAAEACSRFLDREPGANGASPYPLDASVASWATHYGLEAAR